MNDAAKQNIAKHLGYLDGLRAIAAVYVIICHARLQMNLENQPAIVKALAYPFWFGHYAVDVFIVLSGFCLMLPIVKGDGTVRGGALHFFQRRAWRILPPYYLAMAFSLLLIFGLSINHKTGTWWDNSVPVNWRGVVTHLLLVQDAFNDSNINHVFWSIAVEWRIYFLFPLMVLAWKRFGPGMTTLLSLAASYVLFLFLDRFLGSSLSAHYIGLFAAGMLSTTIAFSNEERLQRVRKLPWGGITLLLSGAVLAITFARVWHGDVAPIHIRDYVVGIWAMALLVMIAKDDKNWLTRLLNLKPVVFVGTFAYSIYLIHAPLLQVLWQYPFAPLQSHPSAMLAALVLVGTPLIVGISYLFFLIAERPFLRSRKKESMAALAGEAVIKPAP